MFCENGSRHLFQISHFVNRNPAADYFFHIKVVSGRSFVGLGQNSARLRVPLPQDQEAVLEAIRQIDQQLSEKR